MDGMSTTDQFGLEHGKLYKLSDMTLYCEIDAGVALLFQWVDDDGKAPLNPVAMSIEEGGALHYLDSTPPPEMADWSRGKAMRFTREQIERAVKEPRPSGFTVRDLVATGESAV